MEGHGGKVVRQVGMREVRGPPPSKARLLLGAIAESQRTERSLSVNQECEPECEPGVQECEP